jgi:plastocyanin
MRPVSAILLGMLLWLLLAPAPAVAAGQHVMIMQYAFSAATLTVHSGDTVTWTNHDAAAHDVTTTAGPAGFHSPLLATDQSWTYTFTAPGTYSYYCSVHPDMRAQITVLAANPAPAAPAQPAPPQQKPAAHPPAAPTTTTQPAAPAPAAPPVSTTTPAPVQDETVQAAAVVGQRLDPMLLVAGIVAAVAVLCLLLIGARPD